jgi:SNF2 family DNA or RNA helicase
MTVTIATGMDAPEATDLPAYLPLLSRLRNPRSASGKLASKLSARYLLMLTATPVENRLSDLYQLVNLVAPGLLGTPAQFRARHGTGPVEAGPHNLEELRARIREVMVRHRRSEVAVMLPPSISISWSPRS